MFITVPVPNPCKVQNRFVDLDPDSMTLWIRIRIENPDPFWESGSVLGIRIRIQGKENEEISVEKCTL
jgi:hypothetical protein